MFVATKNIIKLPTTVRATKLTWRHCSFLRNHVSHSMLVSLPEFATAIEDIDKAQYATALPKLQRTCEIMKTAYPPEAPEVLLAKLRLAQVYMQSGDFSHALSVYKEAITPTTVDHAAPRAAYCALATKSIDTAKDVLSQAPRSTTKDQLNMGILLLSGETDAALKLAHESHNSSTNKLLTSNNLAAVTTYHIRWAQSTLPYFLSPKDTPLTQEQLAPALDLFAQAAAAAENITAETQTEDIVLVTSALCNYGEILQSLGNTKEAAEQFNKALKLVENQPTAEGYLGRALYHLACRYMETGEAVTAEGLLKSSFEKFSSPFALHDIRHQYQHARALMTYGTLLTRWEKRENDGATIMAKGMGKLKSLPNYDDVYLNHFLYLPV